MLTKQEIFNIVAKHLIQQHCQSKNEKGVCVYRGKDGMKCAVGVLILDEHYYPSLENVIPFFYTPYSGPETFKLNRALSKSGVPEDAGVYKLLRDLQKLHDCNKPGLWEDLLRERAEIEGLEWPIS